VDSPTADLVDTFGLVVHFARIPEPPPQQGPDLRLDIVSCNHDGFLQFRVTNLSVFTTGELSGLTPQTVEATIQFLKFVNGQVDTFLTPIMQEASPGEVEEVDIPDACAGPREDFCNVFSISIPVLEIETDKTNNRIEDVCNVNLNFP
jgi:hypothetical protein